MVPGLVLGLVVGRVEAMMLGTTLGNNKDSTVMSKYVVGVEGQRIKLTPKGS